MTARRPTFNRIGYAVAILLPAATRADGTVMAR